jgi:hypothetical protein
MWLATQTAICASVHFLVSVTPGDWLVFLAELLVAGVIYLELEHGRNITFMEKASNKEANNARYCLYKRFTALKGTNEEKVRAFNEALSADTLEGEELRKHCNNQLAVFTEMGFELNRAFKFRRQKFLTIFPHAPVQFWHIVGPFILRRRSTMGPWFGVYALGFVQKSIELVLKNLGAEDKLVIVMTGSAKPWVITRDEMKRMEQELKASLANYKAFPTNFVVPLNVP